MAGDVIPIEILPGVHPSTDISESTTGHYILSDKIRFRDGLPEKVGGNVTVVFANSNAISGCARSILPFETSAGLRYLIGTEKRLYYLSGSQLINVTPLKTATNAIANSLDSYYVSLAASPIATVLDSGTITITDTATKVVAGDTITLSAAVDTNGITAAQINLTHFVRSNDTNSFTVLTTGTATSTGSGGGASVILATGIINVNATAHDMSEGDRTGILGAADFAGFTAVTEINVEHIIRNVRTDDFDIVTTGEATSSVTGGGGAGTTYQTQIEAGECDAKSGTGYGVGLYGVGLYGIAKTSTTITVATSWVFDKFGSLVVATQGDQTGLYSWDVDTDNAPVLVANAPTAIDYCFVSNNICVTLGASATPNRVKWSDQGVLTTWTPLATNQAGEDDIENAGRFLSHVKLKGLNLLWTESQIYTFRYIGRPFVWATKWLDNVGIIGKNARVAYKGIVYWMGNDNFYMYRSGRVEVIPSNSTKETTLKKYVFDNINTSQKSKIFAWYNAKFNEVWFHYPSANVNENDSIARVDVQDFTWSPDTYNRSASSYPIELGTNPTLAKVVSGDSTLLRHEVGANDDGAALTFSITSPFIRISIDMANINLLIPDSLQVGDITVTVNTKRYPHEAIFGTKTFTITPTTGNVTFRLRGRYVQYIITGSSIDQTWRAGQWLHRILGVKGI